MSGQRFQWTWTDGGPLILLQEDLLAEWRGTDQQPPRDREAASDYDRACQVEDYAGLISVGGGSGLVLGAEPMDATWWPSRDLAEGLIVRVLYGPGDEVVTRLIESVRPHDLIDTGLQLVVTNPRLQLFNSAYPGTENLGPSVTVTVPIGTYAVHSAVLNEPGSHLVVVHRLVWRSGATSMGRPAP